VVAFGGVAAVHGKRLPGDEAADASSVTSAATNV
jgi:hypothetical protein